MIGLLWVAPNIDLGSDSLQVVLVHEDAALEVLVIQGPQPMNGARLTGRSDRVAATSQC